MSHTMNIKTQLTDVTALQVACERLGIKTKQGKHKLYQGEAEGMGIFLEGWRYPLVLQDDGTAKYDNFNGSWGKQEKLDELTQIYGLEKAKIEARRQGYSFYEQKLENTGEYQLKITVGE